MLEGIRAGLAALLVLVLPGAAWQAWFPGRPRDLIERLAGAVALSISLSALLGLALFLWDVTPGAAAVGGVYAALLVVLVLGLKPARMIASGRFLMVGQGWQSAGWILLLAALLGWRFYQARGLALPAWVDSVHHVLVVAKIQQGGGLPETLGPELPVPFFYHYGFHLMAALFGSAAGVEPARAVLWLGQILNAGVSVSLYRLAMALWGDRRRAVLVLLLSGFAFTMPGYYLAWGRYTLLTGLVLLPVAMAAMWEAARQRQPGWIRAETAEIVLLSGGVSLTHYLALGLLGLFGVLGVGWKAGKGWKPGAAAVLGLLMAAPWLWRVWTMARRFASLESAGPLLPAASQWSYTLALLGPTHNHVLMLLALAGLGLALAKPGARRFGVWALALMLLSVPGGLRLGPFRPDHFVIVLFVPAVLLLANLPVMAAEGLAGRVGLRPAYALVGMACLGLLGWGAVETSDIINREAILAQAADLRALEWVKTHTPRSALFLINTQRWQAGSWRGVDGGYWLLPYAGRQTVLPPAMYGYGTPEQIRQINHRAESAAQLVTCDDAFWSLARETGATMVYLREGVGSLQPAGLVGCANVTEVYREGGVVIYALPGDPG